ncbi:hypothetical protein KRX51_07465 [Corynebacterium sp. TAE3-ERU12]|uniref:hypothetical protein n=1 Tax=Corynebacterium sp. TAE3-ERU12 TaxID=2849491 RepID=UPI001C436AED|nr:hypothetical protein [Corynebacterium sp. TAE3-ERU12]MBV7295751.1 hypothetical protein [Corynebacterium sp. TAE3-ERU12]
MTSRVCEGSRRRRYWCAAALVLPTALLMGCGYDPATATDGGADQSSAARATDVQEAPAAAQYTAHLLADAEQLIVISNAVQASQPDPETAQLAGTVSALAGRELGLLVNYREGGEPTFRASDIADSDDIAQKFRALLADELPRMRASWEELTQAPQQEIAEEANRSVQDIDAILAQLGQE